MKIEPFQPAPLGKVKILLDQVDSTQIFAAQLLKDSPVANGTLILARNQTHGQGRLGKVWHSNPSENFTGSLVLKHHWNISPPPFILSQVSALAVHNLIEDITGKSCLIKWPNDLIIEDKKISGILISNQWKGPIWESSIVGIGINVNQQSFEPALGHAVSLSNLIGRPIDMNEIINKLMYFFNQYYLKLIAGAMDQITQEYFNHLYGVHRPVKFMIIETDDIHTSYIDEVTSSGKIRFKTDNGQPEAFDLDQITILLP